MKSVNKRVFTDKMKNIQTCLRENNFFLIYDFQRTNYYKYNRVLFCLGSWASNYLRLAIRNTFQSLEILPLLKPVKTFKIKN